MEQDNNNEAECRVCRVGGDESRPLYTPCLCSGSIGLVHQDCLEAWLQHSKKDTCELCSAKYQFVPEYRADTPSIVPFGILLKSILSIIFFKIIPFTIRLCVGVVVWLGLVPLGTTLVYCTCMRRSIAFMQNFNLETICTAICYGCVIDAVMALSVLILVIYNRFFFYTSVF
jgi:E3 ubiquitin-protein ligase MARCH6